MDTYIIGDVQGCFDALQALLQKLHFDPKKDRLGFVGDLVNRGPKSLDTLRFIFQLKNPLIVLGNHDLHLLALYFLGAHYQDFQDIDHTLDDILQAPDGKKLIEFLLQQPFLQVDKKDHLAIVHAGIAPQWKISQAMKYAKEAHMALQKNPIEFFKNIYGNTPIAWHEDLTGWHRLRYIVNAFTRMRFCTHDGVLDLENKTDISTHPEFRPWFEWHNPELDIVFGHWASLEGRVPHPHIFALDTGCVWGRPLTALRVSDRQLFSVKS